MTESLQMDVDRHLIKAKLENEEVNRSHHSHANSCLILINRHRFKAALLIVYVNIDAVQRWRQEEFWKGGN